MTQIGTGELENSKLIFSHQLALEVIDMNAEHINF